MSDKPDEVPYVEMETLNSMVPIWQRKKADVKPEEYNEFYREKFHDFADPQRVITVSAEGAVTYKALAVHPRCHALRLLHQGIRKGLAALFQRRSHYGQVRRICCRSTSGSSGAWWIPRI